MNLSRPASQTQLLAKLAAAWALCPHLTFGQLLESVENLAWDLGGVRDYSTRMANLPDKLLEAALDQWAASPAVRARWTFKSGNQW